MSVLQGAFLGILSGNWGQAILPFSGLDISALRGVGLEYWHDRFISSLYILRCDSIPVARRAVRGLASPRLASPFNRAVYMRFWRNKGVIKLD